MGTSQGKNIAGRGYSEFKISEAEVGPVCLGNSGEARVDVEKGEEKREGVPPTVSAWGLSQGMSHPQVPGIFPNIRILPEVFK